MRFQKNDLVLWCGVIYRVQALRVRERKTRRGRRYKKPRYAYSAVIAWDDHRLCPRVSSHDRLAVGLETLQEHQIPVVRQFIDLVPWLHDGEWRP